MSTHFIAAGRTTPTNWRKHPAKGIYVDVTTKSAGFKVIPCYVTSLGGNVGHWETRGASSIYKATATGFRIYLQSTTTKVKLTPALAKKNGWHINWIAMAP
jgi:hypothetical protein